jgi:hypothetical protein
MDDTIIAMQTNIHRVFSSRCTLAFPCLPVMERGIPLFSTVEEFTGSGKALIGWWADATVGTDSENGIHSTITIVTTTVTHACTTHSLYIKGRMNLLVSISHLSIPFCCFKLHGTILSTLYARDSCNPVTSQANIREPL